MKKEKAKSAQIEFPKILPSMILPLRFSASCASLWFISGSRRPIPAPHNPINFNVTGNLR
jgi:hypothetical protein